VKVVAFGSRAIFAADTDAGLIGCVAADGATACGGTPASVPQEAARGVIAIAMLHAITFVRQSVARSSVSNRK
jgi:hypothetical protein